MPTINKKTNDMLRQDALHQLALLGGALDATEDIIFDGTRFIIPENCPDVRTGARYLTKVADDQEAEYAISRVFPYRPLDGAHATMLAIRDALGFSKGVPTKTIFGDIPPQFIDVDVDVNKSVQVPWGDVMIPLGDPGDTSTLTLSSATDAELGNVFQVYVLTKRKFKDHVEGLFRWIEQKLKDESIYRGKCIDGAEQPKFIDPYGINRDDFIYTEEAMAQLNTHLWSPIRHHKQLAAAGQRGKRACLLFGKYGTGKTGAGGITMQEAYEAGFTFILVRPGRDNFTDALQTALMYGEPGAVIWLEDVDTYATTDAPERVSQVLDQFDGIQVKGASLLLGLTTNHPERIHKGMLRPGRLDAVVEIGDMDRAGMEQLIRRCVSTLAADVDMDRVWNAAFGYPPAFVREGIDGSVRVSIALNDGELGEISTDDLVVSFDQLRMQHQMMTAAQETTSPDPIEVALADLIRRSVFSELTDGVEISNENIGEIEVVQAK